MRKLTTALLTAVLLLSTVFSVTASAAQPAFGSITITYSHGDVTFPGLEVYAYRIADVDNYQYYSLVKPFSDYPVSIHNMQSQQQWKNLATTLTGYIYADNLPADAMVITDHEGVVIMNYMQPGMYLILGTAAENESEIVVFESFFAYLPQYNDGQWNYNVSLKPKYSTPIQKTEYSVVKLWQDTDHSDKRPQQVEVEIYRDGTLYKTEILNDANGWKYTWQTPAGPEKWSVVEKNVPDGYSVSVSENGGVFSIVNSYTPPPSDNPPDDPPPPPHIPDTSDTYDIYIYSSLMCVSGLLLIILGVYRNRRYNEEE